MKSRIVAWRRALFEWRRAVFELIGSPRYSRPALSDLDEKLGRYLNYRGGFFIEAGANDGYAQSNTYYLERFLGWRGLLVEPIPDLFEKCKKTRPRSHVYNCALVSESCGDFVEMHYANLMSLVDGALKSREAQARHIQKALECQDLDAPYTVRAPARTLGSILDELHSPAIDFLSLDVEGYEPAVLEGLNIDKHRPVYILVEARFFEEVTRLLKPHYDLVEQLTHHDYLYRLKS